MFDKILIANRGEIACRIIKTARKLGAKTVAVYSDADVTALHVSMADEAIHIGPAPARESYLLGDKIIAAALSTGAQAIHPGYGFLSENADFCRACVANDLVFIGPPTAAIEAMGSKSAAKQIMQEASVPLVPGYHGADQDPELLRNSANKMGYPVLLKACAGGGGKGMRQVWSADEFDQALAAAKRESLNSFGDDSMLVEKYLTKPRHVEIQIFCDSHGNAVYLSERDCSVQRRHQKVIEEAPAPNMSNELRIAIGEVAVQAARAINYKGAGTVEFLLDGEVFYFMEMNTRLQVEHPVTEMVTGQDLVAWQLIVAAGGTLPLAQQDIRVNGHAFEARIYAEDPLNDFLPATGRLDYLSTPAESAEVRVDTGVIQGDEISVHYDPMIAKLVVWADNRERALSRLASALDEYRIGGLTNNINFLTRLARHPSFKSADIDTGFIEKHSEVLLAAPKLAGDTETVAAALFLALADDEHAQISATSDDNNSPWRCASGWRMNASAVQSIALTVEGIDCAIDITPDRKTITNSADTLRFFSVVLNSDTLACSTQMSPKCHNSNERALKIKVGTHSETVRIASLGDRYVMFCSTGTLHFNKLNVDLGEQSEDSDAKLTAPMNGTIVSQLVKIGTPVKSGEPLMVMEAMKMEHTINAPADGSVDSFYFGAGDLVDGGTQLLAFYESGE